MKKTEAIAPKNGSETAGAAGRRAFLKRAAVAASAAAALGPVRASAQPTITLKMQSGIPPKDIFHEQFVQLGKRIEEMSAGRVRIDMLPVGAVTGPFQIMEAVQYGRSRRRRCGAGLLVQQAGRLQPVRHRSFLRA